MDNQMKIIKVLLICIIILGIIFAVKIALNNKNGAKTQETNEKTIQNNNINTTENFAFKKNQEDLAKHNEWKKKEKSILEILNSFSILFYVIGIILNFGEAKLYKKLSMPNWICNFTRYYLIISFIIGELLDFAFVILIALLIIKIKYYERMEINKWWIYGPIIGLIVLPIIFTLSISSALNLFYGNTGFIPAPRSILFVILAIVITYLVGAIKANMRLADEFDKAEGFKIGLILLPAIFKPILGFQKEL